MNKIEIKILQGSVIT